MEISYSFEDRIPRLDSPVKVFADWVNDSEIPTVQAKAETQLWRNHFRKNDTAFYFNLVCSQTAGFKIKKQCNRMCLSLSLTFGADLTPWVLFSVLGQGGRLF